jgi:hypothetical protein
LLCILAPKFLNCKKNCPINYKNLEEGDWFTESPIKKLGFGAKKYQNIIG